MNDMDELGSGDYVAQFCQDMRSALSAIVFSTRAMSSEESNSLEVRAEWLERIGQSAAQIKELHRRARSRVGVAGSGVREGRRDREKSVDGAVASRARSR